MERSTYLAEPSRKNGILEKRVRALRAAVRTRTTPTFLSKAAERVRSAALMVIKAKRFIIAGHPASLGDCASKEQAGSLERQLVNLDEEARRLASLSVEEIVAEYATPAAAPDAS